MLVNFGKKPEVNTRLSLTIMKTKNIFLLLFLVACQPLEHPSIQRPTDHWIMRSVLDQQVRMVSLALHQDAYVAYNTATCALYKVWKGGIHWDGAAFNNIKTVQPTSWGKTYLEFPINQSPWKVTKNGLPISSKVHFKGYAISNQRLTFRYELQIDNKPVGQLFEYPEFFLDNHSNPVFERHFATQNIPAGIEIWNGAINLPINSEATSRYYFEPIEELSKKDFTYAVSGFGSQNWLDRSGCNTCHHINETRIGPSYKAIAQKYDDNEDVIQTLSARVKNGSVGNWGKVAMQAHPNLPEEDIEDMIYYILSLAPRQEEQEDEEEDFEEKGAISEWDQLPLQPGFRQPLEELHPSLDLQTIRPKWFKPRVGGMDFLSDGRLLVSTWDSIGAVYAISGLESSDTNQIHIQKIAAGLSEPLGMTVVDDTIYVLQKHELTQLIDQNGDGVIDGYNNICNSFGATPDFHEFSYGLAYQEGYFFANLGLAMRLMSHELQNIDRGTSIKIGRDGTFSHFATGLRQANGIGKGPDGALFITENQGQWVPACKLIHLQAGAFYGCQYGMGDRYQDEDITAPAVWLPQNEIGNSPGQPVLIPEGTYKDQMLFGEVTHGGIKRAFLEKVKDHFQGAAFRFTQGLEAGINRLVFGPDGALYAGGVGMNGNWGWKDQQFGLQKLVFNDATTFEILKIEAQPEGFKLTFTEPLAENNGNDPKDYFIQQWYYETTPEYGSPKLGLEQLPVRRIEILQNRKSVYLNIPKLKEGHVLYFLLSPDIKSKTGQRLWTGEAWYTLNYIPDINY